MGESSEEALDSPEDTCDSGVGLKSAHVRSQSPPLGRTQLTTFNWVELHLIVNSSGVGQVMGSGCYHGPTCL